MRTNAPPRSVHAVTALALAVVAAAWLRPASAGPTREEMSAVEAKVVAVARDATKKTVAVRVEQGGKALGYGSGAVVSAEGLVLTCAHVTEPAQGGRLVAIFADGREVPLEVVASNEHNDFSLCRMAPAQADLPFFAVAERDPAMGEWVVALGHPGGPFADHRPTVAVGKVTGLNRRLPMLLQGKEYVDAIQTDAPLFGGNSGGPLVDLSGRLAGINGAILLVGDAAFSTPASHLARDLPALREGKAVEGERIGFANLFEAMTELSEELDAQELADAFADTGFGRLLRGLVKLTSGGARRDPAARAPRRTAARAGAAGGGPPPGRRWYSLRRGGKGGGFACLWTWGESTMRWVTSARLVAGDSGALSVAGPLPSDPSSEEIRVDVRVAGRDGALDIAVLEGSDPSPQVGVFPALPPPQLAPADLALGSWVLIPGRSRGMLQAGVVAAVDREVGTDRRVPSLGVMNLFKPSNTSPFRPYATTTQIDCPLAADQFGGPVVRPDGSLVGIAVAHFNRGCTFAVPAARIAERIDALVKGADVPPPPNYDPRANSPKRDGGGAPPKAAPPPADGPLSIWVPTISGVPRRARFAQAPKGAAQIGPVAENDTGAGPLDVHVGDVLLSVDGKPTADLAAARKALAAPAVGATVRIGLMRRTGEGAYRFEELTGVVVEDGGERRVMLRGP